MIPSQAGSFEKAIRQLKDKWQARTTDSKFWYGWDVTLREISHEQARQYLATYFDARWLDYWGAHPNGVIELLRYHGFETHILEQGNEIEVLQFQRQLESTILSLTPQYGTYQKKIFSADTSYAELCIVDTYAFDNSGADFTDYPLIQNSIAGNEPSANIFLLYKNKQVAQRWTIGITSVPSNLLCLDNSNGYFEIGIEGKGDHVEVS